MAPVAAGLEERCDWCGAVIADGAIAVDYQDGTADHVLCGKQRVDEGNLRDFLDQVARDAAGKAQEYRDLHPTRFREHKASAYLARLEAVITAAVR